MKPQPRGYSLVELIVVLLLIGILAVSVVPRFFGTGGIAEYTYQARLIASLRAIQQRAMQDTRGLYCYQVNIATGSLSAFGPAVGDYTDTANQTASCSSAIDESLDYLSASAADMADDGVTILGSDQSIQFNGLGCTVVGGEACTTAQQISLFGEEQVNVCIESQGFIYAC